MRPGQRNVTQTLAEQVQDPEKDRQSDNDRYNQRHQGDAKPVYGLRDVVRIDLGAHQHRAGCKEQIDQENAPEMQREAPHSLQCLWHSSRVLIFQPVAQRLHVAREVPGCEAEPADYVQWFERCQHNVQHLLWRQDTNKQDEAQAHHRWQHPGQQDQVQETTSEITRLEHG